MTTLVYPYLSVGDGDELRYSIRSCCTNLPGGVDQIIIVGDEPPAWLDATHIPGNKYGTHKRANVHGNCRIAANHAAVPDEYVWMNDDFFVMQPRAVELEHQGRTLGEHLAALSRPKQHSGFGQSLRITHDWLVRNGVDAPLSFEGHKPLPVMKAAMAEALGRCKTSKLQLTPQARSIYGNLCGLPATSRRDCKIVPKVDHERWREWPMLSTNELSFATCPVGEHIRASFPNPSKYER